MRWPLKIAFVVPAYHAERTVAPVVVGLLALAATLPDTTAPAVVVVDDGSTDETGRRAADAGAAVVRHAENRGKGAALLTGFAWAREAGARACVSVDADGQHPPEEALALARHPAPPGALVLGVRDLLGAGAPRKNRFSNGFSNAWMSFFAKQSLHDTQCGLRRYPLPEVLELGLRGTGYELESEVILKAIRRGIPVVETNVRVIYPPEHERVTHFHSVRDPARIVARILHTAFTTRARRRAAP
ncbi:MAG TPA: glycosyltransferase family 2 protein [Polyangiaceae bacterium]|nr:glycosyltransferase family 2 protein [Polyangiaceae bacterium]